MKKAEDLASVTAGEPARVADDESNQVDHVVHGTDDAAVGSLRQPHIAGFDGAESISGKSIPVESSDNRVNTNPPGGRRSPTRTSRASAEYRVAA